MRLAADLAALESDDLVIIKLGFFWHDIIGVWEFFRYTRLIQKACAKGQIDGLYSTEYFLYSQNHAGFIQYWRSFADLENWSRKSTTHTDWWRDLEKRGGLKHMSMYHEVYIVDRNNIETIYNLPHKMSKEDMPGLLNFLPQVDNPNYRARERFLKQPNLKKA